MPRSKFTFGLTGGLSSLPLLNGPSIAISLASTSGAGTRFVLRGGETVTEEVELRDEKSVTVCDSELSWRAWYVVAVDGRVLSFMGSHL